MTVSVYGNIPESKQNENEQAVKEPVQEGKMGILGWMNPEDYSFDCMLRMERFQIRYILGNPDEAGKNRIERDAAVKEIEALKAKIVQLENMVKLRQLSDSI